MILHTSSSYFEYLMLVEFGWSASWLIFRRWKINNVGTAWTCCSSIYIIIMLFYFLVLWLESNIFVTHEIVPDSFFYFIEFSLAQFWLWLVLHALRLHRSRRTFHCADNDQLLWIGDWLVWSCEWWIWAFQEHFRQV